MILSPAFHVLVTFANGTTTRSPRIAFKAIAANSAVAWRKRADVVSATVIEA